jgi:hypothetical protein
VGRFLDQVEDILACLDARHPGYAEALGDGLMSDPEIFLDLVIYRNIS